MFCLNYSAAKIQSPFDTVFDSKDKYQGIERIR